MLWRESLDIMKGSDDERIDRGGIIIDSIRGAECNCFAPGAKRETRRKISVVSNKAMMHNDILISLDRGHWRRLQRLPAGPGRWLRASVDGEQERWYGDGRCGGWRGLGICNGYCWQGRWVCGAVGGGRLGFVMMLRDECSANETRLKSHQLRGERSGFMVIRSIHPSVAIFHRRDIPDQTSRYWYPLNSLQFFQLFSMNATSSFAPLTSQNLSPWGKKVTPDLDAGARDTRPETPTGWKRPAVMLVWKNRIMLSQVKRQVESPQPKVG